MFQHEERVQYFLSVEEEHVMVRNCKIIVGILLMSL